MSLPERLSSFANRDVPAALAGQREKEAEPPDPSGTGLVQRCVIIQRDERGYGFTVSGDNPVFVASVKADGAAAKAGVQQGDRIVKVNGTLVTSRNHLDVVKLIKSGSYVALTLLGKPHPGGFPGIISPAANMAGNRDSVAGRVTAPTPVGPDTDRELWQQKVHMTRAMYETAKEDTEKMQRQYVIKPSDKLYNQLIEKERTLKALENQLKQLTADESSTTSTIVPMSNRSSDSEHTGLDSWASSLPPPNAADSMSDSPHTSPSVSPTPNDPHGRHNGQDMEEGSKDKNIIVIDDEDIHSEDEQVNDPGPFADIKLLESRPAHMAIFLNYLISNSDPAPVLFHIICDQYSRSGGNTKELRKWAYEIYSTFIAQSAPLSIGVEDNIISPLDNILTTSANKTDIDNTLRTMFQPARLAVQNEINELLADFCSKKDLGMGNFYGFHKIQANMDKAAEVKAAEELLIPILNSFGLEDNKGAVSDKDQATGWALATFLRNASSSKSSHSSTLERVQTFMMKDKRSIKFPGSKSSRAKSLKGHQFTQQHFYVSTHCSFCGSLIWGVGFQGFQCQSCEMTLHKQCVEEITENCSGKQKKRPKLPLPNRRSTIQSQTEIGHVGPGRGGGDQKLPPATDTSPPNPTQPYPREMEADLAGEHSVRKLVDRYQTLNSPPGPGPGIENLDVPGGGNNNNTSGSNDPDSERRGNADINRSGSLNNKGERGDRPARRAKSDVDVDPDMVRAITQSGSSSTSSLSNRSIESPSTSTDSVNDLMKAVNEDSDLDVEVGLPSLKTVIGEDRLKKLKPKEKKRQEVINELFYTERCHVRNLKIINLLFNRPMLQDRGVMSDLARALFPNIEEMIQLHESVTKEMKERLAVDPVVKDVGDILLRRFDGEAGEKFRKGCAEYCRNQAFALDALKKQTRKEPKLQQFLNDAESNPVCRRLQLKDLVPSQVHRLTKYPLLIDNLLKYTPSAGDEYKRLERALERSKHILAYVNQAVKECENYHRLKDIQKKMDRKSVEASTDPSLADLKNLELTSHKLIFDGPLTWKLRSHRMLDLHVLLFEDMLVLLQKQDDKYVLKCQNTNVQAARDDHKYTHSPVLKLQNVLARNLATDKKSFFVVNISEVKAQMYELTAATSELRIRWCKLINDRAEELKKSTTGGNRGSMIQHSQMSHTPSHTDSHKDPPARPLSPSRDEVDSLRHLEESEEGELIQPEEVSISGAIIAEPTPVRSPLATISVGEGSASEAESNSSGVSGQQQLSADSQAPSMNVPVPMEQLKAMATEMNTILTKLMSAMNSGSEERHRLRKDLEEAQRKLNSLKEMQRQMTESGAVPAGRLSPNPQPVSGAGPDIPCDLTAQQDWPQQALVSQTLAETSQDVTQPKLDTAKFGLDISGRPGLDVVQEADTDLQALNTSVSSELSEEVVHQATVTQLEESVEALTLSSERAVQVTATESRTIASDGSQQAGVIEVALNDGEDEDDDDDDDDNEVSVADLPLPDIVSMRESDGEGEEGGGVGGSSSSRLMDAVDLDDSDTESDDNDTLTSKTSGMDYPSLSTTVEDVVGEQEESNNNTQEQQQQQPVRNTSTSVDTATAPPTAAGGAGDGDDVGEGEEQPSSSVDAGLGSGDGDMGQKPGDM